ncbi:hypothetical protein [Aeromonas salmonicida]|uniref:hypothetical protein n=1 Tax=Aeromonas salmonicida TaxID=645 RepID=UPI003D31458E
MNKQIQANANINEAVKTMTQKQIADKFYDMWPMFDGATVKKRGDYYVVMPSIALDDGPTEQTIRVYANKITVNKGKQEMAMTQLENGFGYCKSGNLLFSIVLEVVDVDFKSIAKTAVEFAHALHDNISSCIDTYHMTDCGFEMHSNIHTEHNHFSVKLSFNEFVFAGNGLCSFEVGNDERKFDSKEQYVGDVAYDPNGTYMYGSPNVFEQIKAWENINKDIEYAIGKLDKLGCKTPNEVEDDEQIMILKAQQTAIATLIAEIEQRNAALECEAI